MLNDFIKKIMKIENENVSDVFLVKRILFHETFNPFKIYLSICIYLYLLPVPAVPVFFGHDVATI